MHKNVNIIKHPLVQHKLTYLRKKSTSSKHFREYINEISILVAYESLKDLKLTDFLIETPLGELSSKIIEQQVNIFPILRAGQGMLSGFLENIPNAKVGHIGLYRNEKTLEPIQYLFKFPKKSLSGKDDNFNIIIDPVIATGNSIIAALRILKTYNFENIRVASIVASEQAIEKINKEFPDVKIFLAAIDKELNDDGYIVPGLGDAGDRIYGTK